MHLITKIVVFLTLLAVESLAANIASHPAKATRWSAVPRSLQGIHHGIIDDMDIEYPPPLRRKDLLTRQAGCSPTQVACGGNKCCPFGFACYNTGSIAGCCPVGETCSGPPIGCADPNSFECPASIGGNDQECYIDSQDVAGCRDTTASSLSSTTSPVSTSAAVPIYGPTSPTGSQSTVSIYVATSTGPLVSAAPIYVTTSEPPPPIATPIYFSGGNPTSAPSGSGSAGPGTTITENGNPTSAPSGGGSGTETGPPTTSTANSVEERMGLGLGVLLVPFVFTLLG